MHTIVFQRSWKTFSAIVGTEFSRALVMLQPQQQLMAVLLLAVLAVAASAPTHATATNSSLAARDAESSCGGKGEAVLQLEMMPDKAKSHGAVCLDGSPGGYYIQMAKNASNNWQICASLAGIECRLRPAAACCRLPPAACCVAAGRGDARPRPDWLTDCPCRTSINQPRQTLWVVDGATPRSTASGAAKRTSEVR